MREKQSYDELMAASNPALGGWRSKGKGGGDGSFVPGKVSRISKLAQPSLYLYFWGKCV